MVSEWQYIETAPLAGEPVLVFCPGNDPEERIIMGVYSLNANLWRIHIDGQRLNPTHWLPLPTPPETDA